MSGRRGVSRALAPITCVLALAIALASCKREPPREIVSFRDPFLGAVPELRTAAISVLVLPGMPRPDVNGVEPSTDGLEGLEVALWETGDVVWCDGDDVSTAEHRHARISAEQVRALAVGLAARIDATSLRTFQIPDAGCEQACARVDGRDHVLASCHELFESNPNLVAFSGGVMALEGRTRDEVLANEPTEFLAFRRTWSEVKEAIRSALPQDGELVDRAKLATLGLR